MYGKSKFDNCANYVCKRYINQAFRNFNEIL